MRVVKLLLAYAAAAVVGTLLTMTVSTLAGDKPFAYFSTFLTGILIFGSALALPVALPAIIVTELQRISNPAVFVLSGLVAGLLVSLLLSDGFYPLETALTALITSVAGLTYWLVAWRLFPPSNPQTEESLND